VEWLWSRWAESFAQADERVDFGSAPIPSLTGDFPDKTQQNRVFH
jgi:hypothetical protein